MLCRMDKKLNQKEPIRILEDNLKIDTMMFIGAWQITYLLIKGYPLPFVIFETQRELCVFDSLVNGYLAMCVEIYDAIKVSNEHKYL